MTHEFVVLDTDVASLSFKEQLPPSLGLALLLPYDREVATTWGELQADGAHRGRTPPQNDTWIAACCLVEDLPLATRNVKDYAAFVEHDGLVLVTE